MRGSFYPQRKDKAVHQFIHNVQALVLGPHVPKTLDADSFGFSRPGAFRGKVKLSVANGDSPRLAEISWLRGGFDFFLHRL
jgi:hypothetical protein